jgi:TolA-binding protein
MSAAISRRPRAAFSRSHHVLPESFSSQSLLWICKSVSSMMHRIRARTFAASLRAARLAAATATPAPPALLLRCAAAGFHTSAHRRSEIKSPFQTFVDVLKEEIQKNRELQQNVKQLQGDVDKLQDSEAMKRARDMYERARVSYNWIVT